MDKTATFVDRPLNTIEYQKIQAFLLANAGITLGSDKQAMIIGRLGKRLRTLGLPSFTSYINLLATDVREHQLAIDLLTTNETYFFREPKHFSFLAEKAIPKFTPHRTIRIWSAACSSGEEPYSIAMVLSERYKKFSWEILATDLSNTILQRAQAGVYPLSSKDKIPPKYLQRFCLRGVGSSEGSLQIKSSLRQNVKFQQVNLASPLPNLGEFDMIWLRNVLIYFDAETKIAICHRLLRALRPGGFFLVGHSESLQGMSLGLEMVQAAVYQKK